MGQDFWCLLFIVCGPIAVYLYIDLYVETHS
jgi:hypothetical protein